jgi:hypothetical protein
MVLGMDAKEKRVQDVGTLHIFLTWLEHDYSFSMLFKVPFGNRV